MWSCCSHCEILLGQRLAYKLGIGFTLSLKCRTARDIWPTRSLWILEEWEAWNMCHEREQWGYHLLLRLPLGSLFTEASTLQIALAWWQFNVDIHRKSWACVVVPHSMLTSLSITFAVGTEGESSEKAQLSRKEKPEKCPCCRHPTLPQQPATQFLQHRCKREQDPHSGTLSQESKDIHRWRWARLDPPQHMQLLPTRSPHQPTDAVSILDFKPWLPLTSTTNPRQALCSDKHGDLKQWFEIYTEHCFYM